MCFVAICINLSLKCKKWRSGNESMKSYIEDILQGWNKHLLRYMFFSKDWKTYEHGELGILERENGNTLIVRVLSKPLTTGFSSGCFVTSGGRACYGENFRNFKCYFSYKGH